MFNYKYFFGLVIYSPSADQRRHLREIRNGIAVCDCMKARPVLILRLAYLGKLTLTLKSRYLCL